MSNALTKLKNFWRGLGPGLITGAADDDPSGIITYSVAGAKFGLATLSLSLITLPFVIIIQRMAGRIGLISGRGLAGNMKRFYPKWLLFGIAFLMVAANIINIGADISGMSAASNILIPAVSPIIFSAVISGTIIVLLIFLSYRQLARYMKWVAIVLLSYILAAFFVHNNWLEILYRTFIPKIIWNKDYLLVVAAFFGTTISPYLFFWQAAEEVEEEKLHKSNNAEDIPMIPGTQPHGPHRSERIIKNEISSMYKDVRYGMIFSNLITYFIIILTSATLFRAGATNINTVSDAASALRPLAGQYANLLFLIGILASGILSIPVLAGSAAYALTEMFGWRFGFENSFHKAKQFYIIIIIATLLGIAIPAFNLHPVRILFYTAVLFGIISPILLILLIHMANNPKIMGKYTSRLHSNVIAYVLFLLMTAGVILMFAL